MTGFITGDLIGYVAGMGLLFAFPAIGGLAAFALVAGVTVAGGLIGLMLDKNI